MHSAQDEFCDDPCEFEERTTEVRLERDPREQEEVDHRHPDLRENGVPGGSEEGFDLEMLLDPLEEELDLPTLLVDEGDVARGKTELISSELLEVFDVTDVRVTKHARSDDETAHIYLEEKNAPPVIPEEHRGKHVLSKGFNHPLLKQFRGCCGVSVT